MELSTAIALIKSGVHLNDSRPLTWADLGAGTGLFTQALATLLPPGSILYAVDKDKEALAGIAWIHTDKSLVRMNADVNGKLNLPELDGAILANVLHYLPDQPEILRRLRGQLRQEGMLVIVEYDTNTANRWVPYPVPAERLTQLASTLRFDMRLLGTERSRFNKGTLYSARLQPRAGDKDPGVR